MIRKFLGALGALFLLASPALAQTTPWSTMVNGSTDIVTLTDTAKFGLSIGAASTRTTTGLEIQSYLAGKNTTWTGTNTFNGTLAGTAFASPPAIGGTTPAAGAFTTLSASSTVSGTGFSTYLASPPAIGGTAPAAGAFTTLSATSTVSGAGITALFASPPAIGGTAAAAGNFTSGGFTGLATFGAGITATGLSSGTQVSCLGLNSSNQVVLNAAACGSGGGGGGSGTVNSGTAGQLSYYATTGTAVSGNADATISNGDVTLGASAVQGSIKFNGSTSGTLQIKSAAVAGSGSVLTFPGGTTDFSSTGGSNQVVQQTSAGGALTVGQLGFSNLSGSVTLAQLPTIATNTVLGNSSGSTTTPSAQTIGAGLVMNTNGLQTTIVDSTKTANYTVAAGDMSGLINLNGTFTLTIPAISSTVLTTGMAVSYQNQGSGNVTISSTPTINGLNSTTVPPGGFGTFVGNGSTLDFTGLSTPTTSAIGGVMSKDCSSGSQFVQKINTDGTISCASPSGSGTVSVVSSGTLTNNAPVIGGGTQLVQTTAAMTNGQLLVGVTSGAPAPQTMSGDCTTNSTLVMSCFATPATVAKGGTGLGTLTAHAVLLGEGTSNVAFATIGTSGRLLIDQGAADPSFNAMSGDATITNTGAITVTKLNGTTVSGPFVNAMSVANAMSNFGGL